MSALHVWLAIIGMGLVTAVTRALFLIGGERMVLPPRVQRVLRYASAAALAGVVVPDLLETPVGISLGLSNHALWASAAGLAYYRGGAALWARSPSACSCSRCCASPYDIRITPCAPRQIRVINDSPLKAGRVIG